MNEWTIVGVIVVLVGLFFTVGKPVDQSQLIYYHPKCQGWSICRPTQPQKAAVTQKATRASISIWKKHDDEIASHDKRIGTVGARCERQSIKQHRPSLQCLGVGGVFLPKSSTLFLHRNYIKNEHFAHLK